MKPIFLAIILILTALGGWWVGRQTNPSSTSTDKGDRKILFYQSAMHPWVKSDKPGRCTICGMELTPVYEGEKGMESGSDIITLSKDAVRILNVNSSVVAVRPLGKTLLFAGTIDDDASRHRILSAYIPGRIEKLYVNFIGAEVQEGGPLAEFYSPALLQTEREYRSATGELRRAVGLRLRQMGLTTMQIEALSQKSNDRITSEILAPITGTVVAQNVYEGQTVEEGAKLFELADFSTMWFQFDIYEQDLPWLKTGLTVAVTTQSNPGQKFVGKITFIDPNFNEATRSTKVRVELANPMVDGRRLLRHRLYAEGLVQLDAPEVLTVPRTAVIQTGSEAYAYVDQGEGAFAQAKVSIGRRGDEYVEVLEGLVAGDKVVTQGNLLIDGQAEMNRSYAPKKIDMMEPEKITETAPVITNAQRLVVADFIKEADLLAAALAADDLSKFNQLGDRITAITDKLVSQFSEMDGRKNQLQVLQKSSRLEDAANLVDARKMFYPFSMAAIDLMKTLGSKDQPIKVTIYECPMVSKGVPGLPKKGQWLQASGTEIRNPYFGADMLTCGSKVSGDLP